MHFWHSTVQPVVAELDSYVHWNLHEPCVYLLTYNQFAKDYVKVFMQILHLWVVPQFPTLTGHFLRVNILQTSLQLVWNIKSNLSRFSLNPTMLSFYFILNVFLLVLFLFHHFISCVHLSQIVCTYYICCVLLSACQSIAEFSFNEPYNIGLFNRAKAQV